MDPITVQQAYSGLKFAIETLRTVVGTKTQIAAEGKIADALDHLGKVQDTLFELRNELAAMQDQNRELKDKLGAQESWDKIAEGYNLVATPSGGTVYHSDGPPPHYACPTCFASQKRIPLQHCGGSSVAYQCPQCKAYYPINEHKPQVTAPPVGRRGGPHGWMRN
jgi:hypothetical protein